MNLRHVQSRPPKKHISGVSKAAHDVAKQFCKERGLQLGVWVSQAIRKEIKRHLAREKETTEHVMRKRRMRTEAILREHVIACGFDSKPAHGDCPIEATMPPFWERQQDG